MTLLGIHSSATDLCLLTSPSTSSLLPNFPATSPLFACPSSLVPGPFFQSMKRILLSSILLLSIACGLRAQTAPDAAELTKLLQDFLEDAGRNDATMHERFWAEDLILHVGVRPPRTEVRCRTRQTAYDACCLIRSDQTSNLPPDRLIRSHPALTLVPRIVMIYVAASQLAPLAVAIL